MLQDAVIREIEIIGEATKNLSVELEISGVRSPRLTLAGLVLSHSNNKRVSRSGFQPSPKSPSATSDTRPTLGKIKL